MRERTWSQMLPVMCTPVAESAVLRSLFASLVSSTYPSNPANAKLNSRQNPGFRAVLPPNGRCAAVLPRNCEKIGAFPHFFPQLWKTSGGDPTAGYRGGSECNTRFQARTTVLHN